MTTTISQAADDKRAGMNLADLRRFVQDTAHLDSTATIRAAISFRGQIQRLEATGDEAGGREVRKPFEPVRIDRW